MEKLANALFSMRGMAVGMLIFFVAIAKATFIESEESTQAAKLWVYNALWFEILLVFLSINLIANIMRYKMWMREKVALFAFHLSFLIIIIGAALTRYAGFEGRMHIREGEASNQIITAEPYVYLNVNDGKNYQYRDSVMKYMAESYPNSVNFKMKFPSHGEVSIEYVDFKSKYIDSLVYDPKGNSTVLDIVLDGMQSNYVMPGEDLDVGGTILYYNNSKTPGIHIYQQGDSLMIRSSLPMQTIAMSQLQKSQQQGAPIADSLFKHIVPDVPKAIQPRTLYQFAGRQFAFKGALPNMTKKLLPTGRKDRGSDYLTLRVHDGGKSKDVVIKGGIEEIGQPVIFNFNGLNYALSYGLRLRTVPFSIRCEDFMMERYPGSDMASSFASDIVIQDPAKGVNKKKHLFMNHVVDYQGYRFFQSSYDSDELGTVLSVNYDWWGTNVTYLGYLLMIIGMILSLIARGGRFRELLGKFAKPAAKVMLPLLLLSGTAFGQDTVAHDHDHDHEGHNHEQHDASHTVIPASDKEAEKLVRFITEEHSEQLASLLVQDFQGRFIPFHTMCDQLLRKIYRANKYEDHNAVQTVISMHMYPRYWNTQKIIQVPTAVREKLKLEAYASYNDLTVPRPGGVRDYRWIEEYEHAMNTPEAKQNEFQKKLIKLTEKFQVLVGIENSNYMRIVPDPKDPKHTWYSPTSQDALMKATKSCEVAFNYFGWLFENTGKTDDYQVAEGYLNDLKKIQRRDTPSHLLPSETKVKMEISYNKMTIFKNTGTLYSTLGLLLLIIYFIKVLVNPKKEKGFNITRKILVGLLMVSFLYHGYGLCARWYISGHAPWSDGYEALIFIAWVLMLAGFIFSRKNGSILASAALLAYCMIFVTEMELLDPQITPLQPVLKSYWLKVHVAVITSSYAFLGLSCMLGLTNLILYLARTAKNGKRITQNINELSTVSELTMMIGCFMLTIGTFLGGIWANESWGRYWGWDPKETWALVSVLVYAIILHLRFIPGLKGKYTFNLMSFWGYSAILFTFFGVNFILVGLHSYAQGDGSVSLPNYVWILVGIFFVISLLAWWRNRVYTKQLKAEL